jgi:hypothetical protein
LTISEALRHQMYQRLVDTFGPEVGDALMEHLPPTGWADVATKRDVDMVRIELRGEMAELRSDLRSEIAELSGRIDRLEGKFDRLDGRFDRLVGTFDMRVGELHRGMASQTRAVIVAMFGMMATSIGGVISVATLVH